MKFSLAVQIGKKHGMSYQKVNSILATEGFLNETTNRPSASTIENGLVDFHTIKSQFTLKMVEFIAWDYAKLKTIFPVPVNKPAKVKLPAHPCIPIDSLEAICKVFSKFGEILEIEVQTPKIGLSERGH